MAGFISVHIDDFTPCLNDNYSPIDVNTLPAFVDMRAMFEYAKKKCVQISQLTKEEKSKFLIPNTRVSVP